MRGFDFDNCSIDVILAYGKRNYKEAVEQGRVKSSDEISSEEQKDIGEKPIDSKFYQSDISGVEINC